MSASKEEKLPNEISNSAQLYTLSKYFDSLIKKGMVLKLPKSTLVKDIKDIAEPTLASYFIDSSTTIEDLEKLKDKISKILKNSSSVIITLSDVPSDNLRHKLIAWFRDMNPNLLIDFIVDESIIGGFILRTETKRFDYSFRSNLKLSNDNFDRILASV